MGVKFILLGDENQLQAIGDCFQGRPCYLKFGSAMLRALAGSNRLVLTEGRRSDMNLFGFYQKLSLGGDYHSLPLGEQIQLAREAFPKQPRDAKFNLVISHRQREQLIREIQNRELARKRAEGAECVVLAPSYSGGANRAQELWLWKSKVLISTATCRGIYNSQLLEVVGIGLDTVSFKDFENGEPVTLSHATVAKHLRDSAALTYASVQGRGFSDTLGLWTQSPRMTSKHLFMGLSRARSSDKVWICD